MGLQWIDFDKGLQTKLLHSINRNVNQFNSQDIVNSLLALDQMGLRWSNFDADLQIKLFSALSRNSMQFNPQEISNSLLVLDQMGLRWHDFDNVLQSRLTSALMINEIQFNTRGIANSLLALSRLCIERNDIIDLLIYRIKEMDSFSPIEVNQILLALTWIKACNGKSYDIADKFEPDEKIIDSTLHQDVSRIIDACDMILEKEKRVGVKGVISVDCYIPSKNLVIEVHGPSHYSVDGSLNVRSEKQAELIKKLGFQYQVISYKDWNELKDDTAKKALIKNLMPSQLNVSASVFRPSRNLDPNAITFKPIYKI